MYEFIEYLKIIRASLSLSNENSYFELSDKTDMGAFKGYDINSNFYVFSNYWSFFPEDNIDDTNLYNPC